LVSLDLDLSAAMEVGCGAGLRALGFFSVTALPAMGPWAFCLALGVVVLNGARTAAVGSCKRTSAADKRPELRAASVRFLI